MSAYDVFLSYTRADAAAAEKLRTWFAERGLRAFLDRYALPAGQPWQPQLEAALAGCRALIVLLGPSGLGEWQQREIQLGVDRQVTAGAKAPFPLIPVFLPGLQNDDIPLGRFLGLNTWVDLRPGLDDPEALQRLVAGAQGQGIDGVATDKLLAGLSPYRGLLPFREQDAGLFFGRKRFVDELVTKVRQRTSTNTVAVVGRSGSGKSSIVYAGLFPALRQEKGVGQEAVWDIVSLRPLAEPLHQLARNLAAPPHGADPIAARDMLNEHAERFRKGKVTVAQLVRDRLQAETGSTRLLLYVDQWEELYTQAQPRGFNTEEDRGDTRDAKLFVDLLLDAAASAPCTLVLSVRSDFYPDLQNHDALRAAVQDTQVSLGPMSQAELQAAIEGPARALGSRVHPDLAVRLMRDIGLDVTAPGGDQYDIGKLPLLEYALEQAWKSRAGRPEIGLGEYRGLEQALEERADQLYERLSPAQQVAAKRLFVSLVTPGEGREDTRARIILPSDPATLAVVETYAGTEARLIVTGDASGSRSAEVSHEALILHWEKLRNWIGENREKLRTRAALMAARAEWVKQKRHPNLLIEPGLRLEAARQLRDQPGDVVIDEVKDYIEASFARDTRRRLWRTGAFAAVAAVAVAMTALAWVAQNLKQHADMSKADAEMSKANAIRSAEEATKLKERAETELALRLEADTLRLADIARKQVDAGRHEIGIQLALAALASHAEGTVPPPSRWRAIDALAWSISAGPQLFAVLPHTAGIFSASFSRDGRKAITASLDNTARVWNAATGAELLVLQHPDTVNRAFFSRDGGKIATSSKGTARVWDAETGAELVILPLHKGESLRNFSPDGQKVLTGSQDGTARFRDAANGRELSVLQGHNPYLSPDGLKVATESQDGTTRVWDAATGAELAVLRGSAPLSDVTPGAFSPDGQKVATIYKDGTTRLWDAATGAELAVLRHQQAVYSVAISPDGLKVITASKDNTARLWDAVTGAELHVLRHPQEVLPAEIAHLPTGRVVWSAPFSSNGQKVVTASSDKTARVWDVATGSELAVLPHPHGINSAAFSPDGLKVLTAPPVEPGPSVASLWDVGTGRKLLALQHEQPISFATSSRDGQKVFTTSSDNKTRVWDVATGTEVAVLPHPQRISFAIFSRDGQKVVTASKDATARVWDAVTGVELLVLRHEKELKLAYFSRDGREIVTTSEDGTARVWDAATGAERLVLRHPPPILSAAVERNVPGVRAVMESLGLLGPKLFFAIFSPDGQKVLTLSQHRISAAGVNPIMENAVRLWDAATGAELLRHEGAISYAEFSPDGQRVATALADGTARLWDAATGAELSILRGHERPVDFVQFDHDGGKVLTVSEDGTARLWDAATGAELAILRGHEEVIKLAHFSLDGERVLTAAADRTVRLWDAASGAELAVLRHENEVNFVRFSLDGQRALTSSASIVRVWQLPPYGSAEGLIAYAKALVSPGLSEAQCREFGIPAPRCKFSEEIRLDDSDHVIAKYNEAIKLDSKNTAAFRNRGNAYYDKGDMDRAIADYGEAIRLNPNIAEFYLLRGTAYKENGDYDRAIADFDETIRLDPEIAQAYLNRGIVNNQKGDYNRAIANFDEAIRLDPKIANAYLVRGIAYNEKGNYDLAIADFDQAIRLQPTNAVTWNERCFVRAISGQLELALEDCNESLRLTPSIANTLDSRGLVYLKLGRLDDAIINYDEALKLDPQLPTALYGRGMAKLRKADVDRGNADIASAKAIKADIIQEFVRYGVPAR